MTPTEETQAAIAALLGRHGVTMFAAFVPQSLSRNSAEKTRTLNWRITFKRASNSASFAIDYSQGVGHIPAIRGKSYPLELKARDYEASEKGRYQVRANSSWQTAALPAPKAADLLHCLTLDATCIDATFEEWCADYGYEVDSRKAEATYDQCRAQSRDALRVLGKELMNEAAALLQDY